MIVEKLLEKGIYCVGTVLSNRKRMAKMKNDKGMNRGILSHIGVSIFTS